MKNLLLFILILFTLSCSLDRTNPLDPFVSGEDAPNEVTNIQISITENSHIKVAWNPVSNVDGFYIYRSQSYNGLYEQIEDLENVDDIHEYIDTEVVIPGNFYWYKMSAYIELDEGKLEGLRSEPKTWN